MSRRLQTDEAHSLRGAIDRPALLTVRGIIEREEPLATPELDEYLNPTVLEVTLDDGLCGADAARLDVQWTAHTDYKSPWQRLSMRLFTCCLSSMIRRSVWTFVLRFRDGNVNSLRPMPWATSCPRRRHAAFRTLSGTSNTGPKSS
jgi:hypothetical protein